jgi:quercetin dioxygenase-like cupin family protein
MKKLLVLVMLGGVALAQPKGKPVTVKVPPLPPSTEDLLVAEPAKTAWVPAEKLGYPAGGQVGLVGQDPVNTGKTMYFKMPGGYTLPLHWHTHGEHAVLIAGKGTLTVAGKPVPVSAGSYVSLPSKTQHAFACEAGAECLMLVQSSGPADINWVKAAK